MKNFILLVVLLVVLTGCGNSSALIGEWENKEMESTYVFESNGDGMISFYGMELTFEYEDDGKQVTLTMTGEEAEVLKNDGQDMTDIVPYEIIDDELNLMGTVFTRAE